MADQQNRNPSDEENPQIEDESTGSEEQPERSIPEPASTADDRSDTSRLSFGSESDEELDSESEDELESDDTMEDEDIDSGSSR